MKTEGILVFSTVPEEEVARSISNSLVEEGLAACVSILPGLESHYKWQGKKEVSREYLLMIKAPADAYSRIEARLLELHPYECPEIISIPIAQGYAGYLAWIKESGGPGV